MKESNYNKIDNTGKKNFVLFAIFLLCITLLRSQILSHENLAFDSNPAIGQAGNTQTLHFFSSPAGGIPPAGLQVDSNQFVRAADNKTTPEKPVTADIGK